MKNTIKCPHCGRDVEITDALTHQIEEQVLETLTKKHQQDLEDLQKKTEEEVIKKASQKFEDELKQLQKDRDEEKDKNRKLSLKLDELLDETRNLRRKDEERELEMKKKLFEEEEKIKTEVRKKAQEEHELKDLEKEKVIQDLRKSLEDMKRKAEQGSQQSQGEILELSIESKLKLEFPMDTISEVKKGVRGADVIQGVVDKLGRTCGTILWESKNAQWADGWLHKLKEDQRQAKADIPVLVSVNLPEGVESFAYKDGVWVCSWKHFLPLAWTLRYNLVSVFHERQSGIGKDEKMQVLYQYLTGKEFVHRIEAIADAFTNLRDELEKEKRYFNTKWARQEKEIGKVMDHTYGMWGDLQGVIGKSLPEIKTLSLDDGGEKANAEN